MFIGENQTAASLLAVAVRFQIRLGYHLNTRQPQRTGIESLHCQRLFLKAYVFDRDISMRLHAPPLIAQGCVDLPEEDPIDGYSVYFLPGGSQVNYFREQVRLAQIQDMVYWDLCSPNSDGMSLLQLKAKVEMLTSLLHGWSEQLPQQIRPQDPLLCVDYNQLICVTALHYTYFQLIIAIHSPLLRFIGNDCDESILESVQYCVTAARALVALLDYHDNGHPFSKYDHISPRSMQTLTNVPPVICSSMCCGEWMSSASTSSNASALRRYSTLN